MILKISIVYFLVINLIAFFIMGADKNKAKRSRWRIQEGTLFKIAFAFGSLGIWAGMKNFRHKTKHRQFTLGIPIIFIIQLILIAIIIWFFNSK